MLLPGLETLDSQRSLPVGADKIVAQVLTRHFFASDKYATCRRLLDRLSRVCRTNDRGPPKDTDQFDVALFENFVNCLGNAGPIACPIVIEQHKAAGGEHRKVVALISKDSLIRVIAIDEDETVVALISGVAHVVVA